MSILAASNCFPRSAALAAAFCLQLLGLRLGFVRLCGGERLVGRSEFGVGAGLEPFQLAQRRRERCCRAWRCRGGFLRLDGRPGGLGGFASERLGTRRRSGDGLRVRYEERRVGKLDRSRVDRRYDHPHPDPRLVEQLLRKAKGHPHAAVRRRISGQRPAMQRDAVPGDALHVRHMGIVIHVRAVVLFLLDEGEDAGRRLASLGAGRHRRAHDPAVGVVERDLLGLDRHDRHDRLACIARRRRLAACRAARLFRCGVGDRRHQCGHRRQHGCNGRPPTPHRHGGLRRRQSICHLIPRLKCLPCLRRIASDRVFLEFTNRRHDPYRRFAPGNDRPVRWLSLIYDSPHRRKGGSREPCRLSNSTLPGISDLGVLRHEADPAGRAARYPGAAARRHVSKGLRPPACTVEDPQDLDCVAD